MPKLSRTPSPTPTSTSEARHGEADPLSGEVRAEQLRLLFEQLPLGVVPPMLASALVVTLSWGRLPGGLALAWLGLVVGIGVAQLGLWLLWRRGGAGAGPAPWHLVLYVAAVVMAGGLVGIAPVLLGAGATFEQLLVMLALIAMLAATQIVTYGVVLIAYLSFLLPLTLPVIVRLLLQSDAAAVSMGIVGTVFVVLLIVAAHQLRGRFAQALKLRLENAALGERLASRSTALEAEMAQRRSAEAELGEYVGKLEQANAALSREVAERARSEEALTRQALSILESEVRLRAIFQNAFDGILTFDAEGRVHDANPAAEHLFGFKADELKRRRITSLLPELRLEEASPSIVRELKGRRADSTSFPASLSVERTEGGRNQLYVCLLRDNTVEQQARQALVEARDAAERANKAKSDFLSSMSHELRTPMNSILGFAQLLQTDPDNPLSDTQKESVDQIARAGWHLLQLINDVLDLAKVEAGKVEAILEDVDLDAAMAECLSLVLPLAEKHGIELVDQATGTGLQVRADYTRLKQVVLNLMSNGIKYNRKNGSVAIEAQRVDDWCEIAVVDTGVGLTAEQIDRIFEPFSRVAAQRDEIEGTGIGLTITRKLVALMGGAIGVESQAGAGSRFWVRIPLARGERSAERAAPVPVATTEAPVATTSAHPRQTVLYVEDNPANLALVEYVLRQRRPHLRLISAHTGELGISLAESQRPDLVILDISLPGMDGYEVLGVLRANPQLQDMPIFALSANAMQRDIEKGLEAGFDDYLTKPIDVPRLLRTIDALLERRAAA